MMVLLCLADQHINHSWTCLQPSWAPDNVISKNNAQTLHHSIANMQSSQAALVTREIDATISQPEVLVFPQSHNLSVHSIPCRRLSMMLLREETCLL